MLRPIVRRAMMVLILGCSMLYVAGCGDAVSGKYADDTGVMSVEFKSGGKATVSIGGTPIETTYTVSGKTVTFTVNGDSKSLTINDDGSLSGGGMTLKKK
jgi:hypothetical protein